MCLAAGSSIHATVSRVDSHVLCGWSFWVHLHAARVRGVPKCLLLRMHGALSSQQAIGLWAGSEGREGREGVRMFFCPDEVGTHAHSRR